ncbi:hypothetical protein [Bradyrhizobium sp. 195]|uniref:hypothetical protein n=1 Tax=Bradyrhizobium sp. 195 TaxID=2782662 RepID=UPI002000A96D|nr:hypothetical protein [Bradyrhizobium sp. 195]UPK31233.1 hypothetical protein IVB26_39495 [Bradyrhizobium sp. 195]
MPLVVRLPLLIGLAASALRLSVQFSGVTPLAIAAAPLGDPPTLDLNIASGRSIKFCWRYWTVAASRLDGSVHSNPDLLAWTRPDLSDPVNLSTANLVVVRRHPGRGRVRRSVILEEAKVGMTAGAGKPGFDRSMFVH